jgi:hypothetical protein
VINEALTNPDGTVADISPCYEPYKAKNNVLDEVLSGSWYKDTAEKLYSLDRNVFVCPIILYVDKTHIDPRAARFNLEPVNFTLAIFKRPCRQKSAFWRVLGYIPELPDSDITNPASGHKARNYHVMVECILSSLTELHRNPSILDNFPLRIGNYVKKVNLRVPVAFVVSDTQGADKLCGRYISYTDKVSRLHRSCVCPQGSAADPNQICRFVTMEEMMEVIDTADREELQSYSQHAIPRHAFREVDFGENPHGIYGATPLDILHGIKLGIIPYVLEVYLKDNMTDSTRHHLDLALKGTLPHLKQGGNRGFPRMYFPNGMTALSKLSGEEHVGVLFINYVIAITRQGRSALRRNDSMATARIDAFVKLFEKLLTFLAWMSSSTGFWRKGDETRKSSALDAIRDLMKYITDNFHREGGQGWNLSKLHEILHAPHFIDVFGAPSNSDAGPCESMHIPFAKDVGRRSQKRHETFDQQSAGRLVDQHVVDVAYNHLVVVVEEEDVGSQLFAVCTGSTFVLKVSAKKAGPRSQPGYDVVVEGVRGMNVPDLESRLHTDLVSFLVVYMCNHGAVPPSIRCKSEYVDEHGTTYRAHPDYQGNGFWYNWAWVSYQNDNSPNGYTNVPAKLLCFLPEGLPHDKEQSYVVCHPCKWTSTMTGRLARKWILDAPKPRVNNGIPYDIVPTSALCGHVFIVPDIELADTVYEIFERTHWPEVFCPT